MKVLFNIAAIFKSEKGVTAVYVALLISVFIGFAALAVDIGYLMVTKNELQNAADAAALAGAKIKDNSASAKTEAVAVARMNMVSGKPILLSMVDARTGQWTLAFAENNITYDAVKVKVSTNGLFTTFFTKISNIYSAVGVAFNNTVANDIGLVQ